MEEFNEEREEKAENNTSKEGSNIVLVIISACVLIITVTVAAIFLLHPSNKNKEHTEEMAYTGDIRNLNPKADATQAQVENKDNKTEETGTGTDVTIPLGSSGTGNNQNTPTETSVKNEDTSNSGTTAKQGTNALNYTYGDPNAKSSEATKKLTTTPEVIVEKRYDPKTDLPAEQNATAPVHSQQQGKLQPPVRNTTTAITNKQELMNKPKTVTDKNTSLATIQQSRTITVKEYWIQVASFKSKTRAESLNEKLRQLGYAGTIKTTNIEGETLFRVRLGPYSNNGEAEKFRNWLIGIDGLEKSYVSQSTKKKTIN